MLRFLAAAAAESLLTVGPGAVRPGAASQATSPQPAQLTLESPTCARSSPCSTRRSRLTASTSRWSFAGTDLRRHDGAQDFSPSFIAPSPWAGEKMRAPYDAESPLSYEFCHTVRATGTPVEMIVFPVNGHNPGDPLHREERTHIWIDWFAKHF